MPSTQKVVLILIRWKREARGFQKSPQSETNTLDCRQRLCCIWVITLVLHLSSPWLHFFGFCFSIINRRQKEPSQGPKRSCCEGQADPWSFSTAGSGSISLFHKFICISFSHFIPPSSRLLRVMYRVLLSSQQPCGISEGKWPKVTKEALQLSWMWIFQV